MPLTRIHDQSSMLIGYKVGQLIIRSEKDQLPTIVVLYIMFYTDDNKSNVNQVYSRNNVTICETHLFDKWQPFQALIQDSSNCMLDITLISVGFANELIAYSV